MRHLNSGAKLGRNPAHRRATLRNLVTNVIEKERITTTIRRAKAARPLVERMITLGKGDSLHTRRQVAAFLLTPVATRKLFEDIAPRFADRAGGYTRIIHAGFRIGDGAQLAILELLGSKLKKKEKKEKQKAKAEEHETPEKAETKA
jgi:large subunit ribosomal protein L17